MNDNIVSFPGTDEEPNLDFDYEVKTTDGNIFVETGFLIFTQGQIAVMRQTSDGALPVLVVPMSRVEYARLLEDEEAFDGVFDA